MILTVQRIFKNSDYWNHTFLARLTGLPGDSIRSAYELQEGRARELLQILDRLGRSAPGRGLLHGHVLYCLCRLLEPQTVVETGVSSGVSSSVILRALEDNQKGELISIELPEVREPGWLIPAELRRRWRLMLGRSQDVLPSILEELGTIDLFLHDSEHTYENMMFEYDAAWKFLRVGGILVSDDIGWNSAFLDFARSQRRLPSILVGRFGGIVK